MQATDRGKKRVSHRLLLASGEPPADPPPEDPRLRYTRGRPVREFAVNDPPGLVDSPIVHSQSVAGAKREPQEVEPPAFVGLAAAAAGVVFYQGFPDAPKQGRWPLIATGPPKRRRKPWIEVYLMAMDPDRRRELTKYWVSFTMNSLVAVAVILIIGIPTTIEYRRASRQEEVGAYVYKLGGNWWFRSESEKSSPNPSWARQLFGRHFLSDVHVVWLKDCQVTGDDLVRLHELESLKSLSLEGTNITDADLKHLLPLTELEGLAVARTSVTDAGLKRLKAFPNLKQLNLAGTQITDAGLAHLKATRGLEFLNLCDTEVTSSACSETWGRRRQRRSVTCASTPLRH